MNDTITSTLDQATPPKELSKPLQALWWLKKGGLVVGPEWEMAHNICQSGEGAMAFDWIHALAHWIEADMGNSDYWYRLAGKRRTKPNVSEEWAYLVETLQKPE